MLKTVMEYSVIWLIWIPKKSKNVPVQMSLFMRVLHCAMCLYYPTSACASRGYVTIYMYVYNYVCDPKSLNGTLVVV